jgi:hypothetical protein
MTRGWIVGSFTPSLYNKNYEIGFKYYAAGDYEPPHKHMLSEELTVILLGEVEMNGVKYVEGDIVIQEKGEYTDFKCLSDRAITAVYRPDGSFVNDKYHKDI